MDKDKTKNNTSNSPIVASEFQNSFGFPTSRLETPYTRGIVDEINTADKELASVTEFSIVELNKLKKRYKSEQERNWFARMYPDVMKGDYGVGVSIHSDQRPEIIMKHEYSIQGYDIDGTDDATLGVSSGKALGDSTFFMPRKYFEEHGSVWFTMVIRFPTIMEHEMNPLHNVDMANPTFKQIAGNPDIIAGEEPASDDLDSWSTETGNIDIGTLPYGQWYRHQCNYVDIKYDKLQGYPWINSGTITNHQQAVYVQSNEYNDIFQSKRFGNAQAHVAFKMNSYSNIPDPRTSIFAGSR